MADTSRIDDLRRRVQKDPASIVFAQLAEELRRAGAFQDAIDVCREGLTRHPTYLSAHVTLGRALLQMQRLDEARLELELVRRDAPQNLAALRGLAEIHRQRGEPRIALTYYQAASALAPNDPELERAIGALLPGVQGEDAAVADRASRTVAALEQWLEAIHATRA